MSNDVTKEPGSTRLVLSLAIAGFISGVAIIGIYEATLSTITENKARELREAVFKVLPGVSQLQQLQYKDDKLVAAPGEKPSDLTLYGGYDEKGGFIGYAIPSAGPGFQDTIKVLYGYLPESRRIVGMEILESRETPGLGDKIYKDPEFVANFANLAADPSIKTMKKGTKSAANEIDAITGATISSKAVARIINEGHQHWKDLLPPPGNEPKITIDIKGGER
ncbi:FMN-binding protein [Candidatus Vondammii sp. HM_W22]|uniref:FMN-binding protein n=1 Tax=Candidatus Vondammii sp. HM_W22 TaxID=2687299 RepID=UPI001F1433A6|nr:FMN-binding protein [Candidatus Vondammii sp. HM_W22]